MIEANLTPLTPKFLQRDRNGYALMKALEAGLDYFLTRIDAGLQTVTDIDSMPEWRLDEMAWELNVEWYDSKADVEEKRQTIKDAQAVYSMLGTPEAVLMAVNGVFGSGRVEEWNQYSGDPFHFRVYVTDEDASTDRRAQFEKMISVVKNAAATLDNVYYMGEEGEATAYTGAGLAGIYAEAGAEAEAPST